VIRLYRDIIRCSKRFTWMNEKGMPWNMILKESARKEFEMNRHIKDPKQITSLIVNARESIHQLEYKLQQKQLNLHLGIKLEDK